MKRALLAVILASCGACIGAVALRADDAGKEKELRANLVGTWRMVSMKVNGEANDLPNESITYKHITPAGFVWLSYKKDTGKIYRAGGGTWALHGNVFTDRDEYGVGDDFDVVRGHEHRFTAKVEGDRWF